MPSDDTNLTGAFLLAQAVYLHLKRAGRGKIINIGSMMSLFGSGFSALHAHPRAAWKPADCKQALIAGRYRTL